MQNIVRTLNLHKYIKSYENINYYKNIYTTKNYTRYIMKLF